MLEGGFKDRGWGEVADEIQLVAGLDILVYGIMDDVGGQNL